MTPVHLLLLGGTAEGAALAQRLAGDDRLRIVTSLAGRTRRFRAPPGDLRVGGFGGVEGLVAYLREQNVGLVVDATHPFAAAMAAHAAQACSAVGCPRLKIVRPPWREAAGDRWIRVADAAAAAAWLAGQSGTALLTVGRQELDAFAGVAGPHLIARMIDPPERSAAIEILLGRGPFAVTDEERLMRERGVSVVVAKNSGGAETQAKLTAARRLGIPVVMIERPAAPPGDRVESADEAAAWVSARLAHVHP